MSYDLACCRVSRSTVEGSQLVVKEGRDDHPAAQLLMQRADQAAADSVATMVLTHDDILDVSPTPVIGHRAREGDDLVSTPACDGRSGLEESRELALVAFGPPSLSVEEQTNGRLVGSDESDWLRLRRALRACSRLDVGPRKV
jgi:hypothetical protein